MVAHGGNTREYSTILKKETDPSWGNNSTIGPIVWSLPPGIMDKSIARFGIRPQSHNATFSPETDASWKNNSVLVTYPGGGGQVLLVEAAGVSLFRLTADQPQWETTEIGRSELIEERPTPLAETLRENPTIVFGEIAERGRKPAPGRYLAATGLGRRN
jgi:hypothetical protein